MNKLFKDYLQLLTNNFLIIGPSKAGKTSILFRLKTGKFLENVRPTIGINKDMVKNTLILEIGGQLSYRDLWDDAIKNKPLVILFVVDITRSEDLECYRDFRKEHDYSGKVLLIANKIDLRKNVLLDDKELLTNSEDEILFCSAKTGENIWRLGEFIAELSLKNINQKRDIIQISHKKEETGESSVNDEEVQTLLDEYEDKF
ncbi:MAG: ADP-ribosylation factor-like protein [Candidatus Hodarchaeales archaeon]